MIVSWRAHRNKFGAGEIVKESPEMNTEEMKYYLGVLLLKPDNFRPFFECHFRSLDIYMYISYFMFWHFRGLKKTKDKTLKCSAIIEGL